MSEPTSLNPGTNPEALASLNAANPPSAIPKNEQGQYILKVGEKEVPVDEKTLYTMASKAHGADARFEEAAKIRQEKQELVENLLRADQGDLEAYSRVLQLAGYDAGTVQARVAAWQEAMQQSEEPVETPAAKPAEKPVAVLPEPIQQAVDGLGADRVASLLAKMDSQDRETVRNRILDETWEDVAKTEGITTIVSGGGSKAAKLRKLSDQLIASRIRGGEKYGELLRSSVAREVAEYAAEMAPVGYGEPTPTPGLGLAPSISLAASQAQKVEMPSINDPQFSEKLTARMAQISFQEQLKGR